MREEEMIEAFEEWVADEMGNTVGFVRQMRGKNILGAFYYKREEMNKRWKAWCAAMRFANRASKVLKV